MGEAHNEARRLTALPSLTAERVARRRAAHQLLDRPLVLDDPIAVPILGPEGRCALDAELAQLRGADAARTIVGTALRAFMVARSRFAEDSIRDAYALGVRQLVVLGAGLDTFAYRNPYPDLAVFEVDHPSTQAWKLERLRAEGIAVPEGARPVRYVPVDFDRQSLAAELEVAGFRPALPSFFSWLGVTMYLEPASVWSVLEFVTGLPARSAIAFDYAVDRGRLNPLARIVVDRMADRVAALGEPWTASFDPDELESRIGALGLTDIEHLDGATINARWFAGRSDGLRVGSAARLIRAGKP